MTRPKARYWRQWLGVTMVTWVASATSAWGESGPASTTSPSAKPPRLEVDLLTPPPAPTEDTANPIRLATDPTLSPDGKTLVFAWRGDLWSASSQGGAARPLTRHPAMDRAPRFSPDGKQLAFVSERAGESQVFIMPAAGGTPRQVTFHTAGCMLQDWYPAGDALLIQSTRDHYWNTRQAMRFFRYQWQPRAETLITDTVGDNGQISPDGQKLLFTREGSPWWRKGYTGSIASQIWMYDPRQQRFTRLLAKDQECRSPLWNANGTGFYYIGAQDGTANLRFFDLSNKTDRVITSYQGDGIVEPCVSRQSSVVVFRHLFDLYRWHPDDKNPPQRLTFTALDDQWSDPLERRVLQQATAVAFAPNGLDIAFIAGGDLWVMDTELREPRRVTATPGDEASPVFAPDGNSIAFIGNQNGQHDLFRVERADSKLYWWQSTSFKIRQLTNDPEYDNQPRWSPDGQRIAFIKARGDLWTIGTEGEQPHRVFAAWNAPEFDWSPDGKWFVYSLADEEFNRDVFILPSNGMGKPYNISRHPDNDGQPVWSPDGKTVAFTGRRGENEIDIHYVHLELKENDKDQRARAMEEALKKRTPSSKTTPGINPITPPSTSTEPPQPTPKTKPTVKSVASAPATLHNKVDPKSGITPAKTPAIKVKEEVLAKTEEKATPKPQVKNDPKPKVVIDFDRLHERVRRVTIANVNESDLFWAPDSKRLGYAATVEGKRALFTLDIPGDAKPKPLVASALSQVQWLSRGNQLVGMVSGVPTTLSTGGTGAATPRALPFRAAHERVISAWRQAIFDECWRLMRDHYYDGRLGNHDWNQIRQKYRVLAAEVANNDSLVMLVQMMLGELNGSHLGFTLGVRDPSTPSVPPVESGTGRGTWQPMTPHLGVRFSRDFAGPGLQVAAVIPESPATRSQSRLQVGEVILSVNGVHLTSNLDWSLLNGPRERDLLLRVRAVDGKERDVMLRPISFTQARELSYSGWVREKQQQVEQLSKGALGYLHIKSMDFPSFYRFEQELFAVGAGKEGLVIDVRDNGGGMTTDHLLTILTQPRHAITVPRGGITGYPQDRKIYATWHKPIVVLCNQNSFSNAEIFSHAIKNLGRGKLVGVPTAGWVISTGSANVMGVGMLRMPFRGWYLPQNGEDMELFGAVPDHVLWPNPADQVEGLDTQLNKAVEVLLSDVADAKKRPQPRPRNASERPGFSR